jgi:sirohydrochlorin ferrochelatase
VGCAFLELASPSIPEAIDTAVAAGARELHLVAYFLSAGRHVAPDIPDIIDNKRRQHPATAIHLHPHLGSSPAMPGLVLNSIDPAST